MAKLSFVSCILFLLLVVFTGNNVLIKMTMVRGEDCYEDIGACDADCFARCKAAHPNGQGTCAGAEICRCTFTEGCKSCTEGLLPVSLCGNNQCESACTAKHPNRGAEGYCVPSPTAANFCMCDYDCW